MKADELHAIVQGLPREAWPEGLTLINGCWCPNHVSDEIAILAHETSMARWLEAKFPEPGDYVSVKKIRGKWLVHRKVTDGVMEWLGTPHSHPTRVEALAAAVRAVAGSEAR